MSFLFLSVDVFACGSQGKDTKKENNIGKSCCSSKNSGDNKNCCCSNSEKDEKETKNCDGSCKHNGCSTTTSTSFYLEQNDIFPLTIFKIEEEVLNMWTYSQPKFNPVYLSIWQPPKI
jgi:hypothetical protein